MQTSFIRLYREDELMWKIHQTEKTLQRIQQEAEENHYIDYPKMLDAWIQFEATCYIVSESLITEEYEKQFPNSLFVECKSEYISSNELINTDILHNKLLSLQLLYNSTISFLKDNNVNIQDIKDYNKRELVAYIASDIFCHIDKSDNVWHQKVENILEWLNNTYLQDEEDVTMEEVVLHVMATKDDQEVQILDLVESLRLTES